MTLPVQFMAQCLGCKEDPREFTDYHERSTWVGEHRVKTGHSVHVWIAAPTQ